MSIYIPYFYIIQEVSTGKYYAGAKWAKGCHPDDFMIEDGYQTSSNVINDLIEQNGLESFVVRKIRLFESGVEAYDYETKFLEKVNASKNNNFFNAHNNTRHAFGSNEFANFMIDKYGVDNYSKTEDFGRKYKQTMMDKHGVDNYSKTEDIGRKYKQAMMDKYGVDNGFHAEEVKDKIKQTTMERYGVEYYSQSEEGRKALSKPKWSNENYFGPKSDSHKANMSMAALKRERIECDKCGQGYTKANFNKHHKSCKGKKQRQYKKMDDGVVRRS